MDIAMRFEETVKRIWGRPLTSIYFAGYYPHNETTFKALLLTLCIYELNYSDKYNDEEKDVLRDYESVAGANNSTHTQNIGFLKFLYEKNVGEWRN